jgi:hypothetical protein
MIPAVVTSQATPPPLSLLTKEGTFKHKVSSILNKNALYASKHMFTEDLQTCWNSDQGGESGQYILIDFQRLVHVYSLSIMFQGGFVGQEG